MKEESRIEALEHEMKILKNEIHATLLEIREQILNHYYPELRAEEPMHNHSLRVRQQVGRPGAPAKSASRPAENTPILSEIEAKGQVQPFSDIFLEDLTDEDEDEDAITNELVNSRRPTISLLDDGIDDEIDDDYEDEIDDNFEDLLVEVLHDDTGDDTDDDSANATDDDTHHRANGAGPIKAQKIIPSPNSFGRAPKTREVDFRQLKHAGATKSTGNSESAKSQPNAETPPPTKESNQPSKTNRPNIGALATWVNDAVNTVGQERTIQIVETYATGGKLSSETKNSLLQIISLAGGEEPTSQIGSQDMLGLMVALDQILR